MNSSEIKIKKSYRTGYYCVLVPTPKGHSRWVSTGETNRIRAQAVLEESGVDRLVHLANTGCLTANALSVVTRGRKFMCEDVLKSWREASLLNLEEPTVSAYERWLMLFFERLGFMKQPLTSVEAKHLDAFVNEDGLKHATRRHRLAALKSLFDFATAYSYVLSNLPQAIRVRSREMSFEELTPETRFPMTAEEVDRIVNLPRTPLYWQRATIIGYWTGLRMIDIFCMEWASISDTAIKVFTKKRKKWVTLPLTDPLIGSPQLFETLAEMRADERKHPVHCFPLQRDMMLHDRSCILSMQFRLLCDKLGIKTKSFHCLRYSFCARLFAAGRSLDQIADLAGHSRLATTAKYSGTQAPFEPVIDRRRLA